MPSHGYSYGGNTGGGSSGSTAQQAIDYLRSNANVFEGVLGVLGVGSSHSHGTFLSSSAGLPTPPDGMHYMVNGDLMTGAEHVQSESVPSYQETLRTNNGYSDANTSSRQASAPIYSDLPFSFRVHPNTYDVRPIKDLNAIKQSVKNLVLSNFTDRPFQPHLGSNVTALLFELADVGTAVAMREEIKRVLKEHEPRVANVTVQISDNMDANAYQVTVGYLAVIANTYDETTLYLERIK